MGIFKKDLKDRVAEKCSGEIATWKEHQAKKEKLQTALDGVNGKLAALRSQETIQQAEVVKKIDAGLPVTLLVAKQNALKVEREEYESRASALSWELSDLLKQDRMVDDRLHRVLRRTLQGLLPEKEAEIVSLIEKAIEAAAAWEKNVYVVFSEFGFYLDRKDEYKLLRSFWELGKPLERLSAYHRPDLDGIGHQMWRREGGRAVA